MNCTTFKNIKLKPYQKLPVKFIENPLNRGILLLFNVGFGKTITSIAMLNCLLTNFGYKKAIVLTPATLVSNYQNEIDKVVENFKDGISSKIEIESYGKFVNRINKYKLRANSQTILVFDEVQNLIGENSKKFEILFNYSKTAGKVILLSATPMRNRPSEITNLLSLINGKKVSRKVLSDIIIKEDNKKLDNLLKCKIMIHGFGDKGNDYAKRIDHDIYLKMPKDFYYAYYNIQQSIMKNISNIYTNSKDLTTFINGIRRGVNKANDDTVSPKITWTINKIKEDLEQNKKILVYSNWLDSGVNIIKEMLEQLNIKYSIVTGSLSRKEKNSNIQNYNEDKTNVMLITSSGSEGLSLKNTRTVIIIEKTWNNSKLEQVIGRAIRLGSHSSLPEKKRIVDVYNLILTKPLISSVFLDFTPSADQILMNFSETKDKNLNKFYDFIKKINIENDESCF